MTKKEFDIQVNREYSQIKKNLKIYCENDRDCLVFKVLKGYLEKYDFNYQELELIDRETNIFMSLYKFFKKHKYAYLGGDFVGAWLSDCYHKERVQFLYRKVLKDYFEIVDGIHRAMEDFSSDRNTEEEIEEQRKAIREIEIKTIILQYINVENLSLKETMALLAAPDSLQKIYLEWSRCLTEIEGSYDSPNISKLRKAVKAVTEQNISQLLKTMSSYR